MVSYIVLSRDVELLVADPAFAATSTGQVLRQLADRYGFELKWHGGFRLPVCDVPDDFRGPAMPAFAQRVAGVTGESGRCSDRPGRGLAAPRPRGLERFW